MSRAVKWSIPFKTEGDIDRQIDILVEGYSGSPIILTGGENPIETQETDDDDIFRPLRTQSGYIRIFSDGHDADGNPFDYRDLWPETNTSHQVVLLQENQVLWIGYMKAESLTSQLFHFGNEYEYPIMCPLELLKHIPLTFDTSAYGSTVVTMCQALHLALSATEVPWEYVDFPYYVNNYADLNARVNLTNFVSADADVTETSQTDTWTDTSTMAEMVEKICTFWGWSLRSSALNLSLLIGDEGARTRRVAFQHLDEEIQDAITYNMSAQSMNNLEFVSDEHNEEMGYGRKKITVTATSNEQKYVLKPDLDEAVRQLSEDMLVNYDTYERNGYRVMWHDVPDDNAVTYLDGQRLEFIKSDPSFLSPLMTRADVWSVSEAWQKETFNFTSYLFLAEQTSVVAKYRFSIRTMESVCLPAGSMIYITGKVKADLNPGYDETMRSDLDYFRFYLRCGDKWLTPDGWSSTQPSAYPENSTVLHCHVGGKSGERVKQGDIITTKDLYDNHEGASGFCMAVPSSQVGRLELCILSHPTRQLLIDTIEVRVTPTDWMIRPTKKEEHSYKTLAASTFSDDLDVDLDMTSGDNNTYGRGQLYDINGDYLTEIPVYLDDAWTTRLPEEHLLRRLKQYYQYSSHRVKLQVKEAVMERPAAQFTHWDNGETYLCQGISHNWKEETMELTLIRRN